MLKSVKRTPEPLQPDASYKSCTSSTSQLNRGKAVFEKLVAGPSRMPKNSPLTSRERRSKTKKLRFDWRPLGRGGGRAEEWLTDSELCVSFLLLLSRSPLIENTNFAQEVDSPFCLRMPVRRTRILCLMSVELAELRSNFPLADS